MGEAKRLAITGLTSLLEGAPMSVTVEGGIVSSLPRSEALAVAQIQATIGVAEAIEELTLVLKGMRPL